MSDNTHFRHLFHAAGHGTFFSAEICQDWGESSFHWGYDCGSKSTSHLRGLIEDYSSRFASGHQGRPSKFDLFCISHFDTDHVNGLDVLFSKFKVGTLALPYVPLHVRLQLACQIEDPDSASVAALIAAPLTYLSERGYTRSVDRVVFLRGGVEPDTAVEVRAPEVDSPQGDEGPEALRLKIGGELTSINGTGYSGAITNAFVVSGSMPWVLNSTYEWCFFNKRWPESKTPQSGVPIDEVAEEVDRVFRQFDVFGNRPPKPGWIEALRALYDEHFGCRPSRRNDISLCVLGLPTINRALSTCKYFNSEFDRQEVTKLKLRKAKPGVLLLGDFSLTTRSLLEMKRHFGSRWDEIGVLQIPHHGSKRSWKGDVIGNMGHQHYVICAPGTDKHPHKDVVDDLPEYWLADYDRAIEYVYHG